MSGRAAREKERKSRQERVEKRQREELHRIVLRWWKGRNIIKKVWNDLVGRVNMKKVLLGQGMDLSGREVLNLCTAYKILQYNKRSDKSDDLMKILNCSIQKQETDSFLHYHNISEQWLPSCTNALNGILGSLLEKKRNATEIDFTLAFATKLLSPLPWKKAGVTSNKQFLDSLSYELLLLSADVNSGAPVSLITCKAAVFSSLYKPAVFLAEFLSRPPVELEMLKQHIVTSKITFSHPFWIKLLSCSSDLDSGIDDDDGEAYINPECAIFTVCSLYKLAVATLVMTRLVLKSEETSFPESFYELLNIFFSRFPPRSILNKLFTEHPDVEKALLEMRGNPKVKSKYDLFYAKTLEENPPPLSKAERRRRQKKRREQRERQNVKDRQQAKEVMQRQQKQESVEAKAKEVIRKQRIEQIAEFWSIAVVERDEIEAEENELFRKINESASGLKSEINRIRKADNDRRMQRLNCMELEYRKRIKFLDHQDAVWESILTSHVKNTTKIYRNRSKLQKIEPAESSTRLMIISSQTDEVEHLILQQQLTCRRIIIMNEMRVRAMLLTEIIDTYFWLPFSNLLIKEVI